MRLVYTATMKPVALGDTVNLDGRAPLTVDYFAKPHKPDSEGKVSLRTADGLHGGEYFVSIIGAEWIEREDRGEGVPLLTPEQRATAIAAVMENEQVDAPDAEKIVDARKVIVGKYWFCKGNDGQLYGGPLHPDGSLNFVHAGFPDMEDFLGDDREMLKQAEIRLGISDASEG